eukprot:scaffold16701_cov118-Isochrysis_galbana.AAC.1
MAEPPPEQARATKVAHMLITVLVVSSSRSSASSDMARDGLWLTDGPMLWRALLVADEAAWAALGAGFAGSGGPPTGGRYSHRWVPNAFSEKTRPAKQRGMMCTRSGSKTRIRSPKPMKRLAMSATRCVRQLRWVAEIQEAASRSASAKASWAAQQSVMTALGTAGGPGSGPDTGASRLYSSMKRGSSCRSSPSAHDPGGLGGGLSPLPREATASPAGVAMPQRCRAS